MKNRRVKEAALKGNPVYIHGLMDGFYFTNKDYTELLRAIYELNGEKAYE